ncbi:hypothetical protein CEXT_52491 [Caerostris extrusa]|uniref:Uncharacterized protein n=1 Tax=Caerostris extrusa TaxID=172846 RepID=A0AAV4NG22_CAEEX|nr:hypothetical protein CEXT_52491 [Caerostris extrusa]
MECQSKTKQLHKLVSTNLLSTQKLQRKKATVYYGQNPPVQEVVAKLGITMTKTEQTPVRFNPVNSAIQPRCSARIRIVTVCEYFMKPHASSYTSKVKQKK